MHHRSYAIRLDAGTCQRLARLRRRTGTPVQKLVNAILRDFTDELALTLRRSRRTSVSRSWRRR